MAMSPFGTYTRLKSEQELERFRQEITEGGFTPFRLFLEGFRDSLKSFGDGEAQKHLDLVATARRLFPEPHRFSPSWALVWDEYEKIAAYKGSVLESIPAGQREGEWQVLLDNPFTNSDLVCYPAMPFLDAAYMYAYFRTDLKKNEYLRLQKVENVIIAFGSEISEVTKKSKDR